MVPPLYLSIVWCCCFCCCELPRCDTHTLSAAVAVRCEVAIVAQLPFLLQQRAMVVIIRFSKRDGWPRVSVRCQRVVKNGIENEGVLQKQVVGLAQRHREPERLRVGAGRWCVSASSISTHVTVRASIVLRSF